jgi:glyoxylase-like metal-dependent hydrolase (beta-lactamase superfamily II)
MLVRQIADSKLAQFAYLIGCPRSGEAIVIDPERDVDRYFDAAARNNLRLVAAVDTHIHADYLSGLREMAERGLFVYASKEGGPDWQYEWLRNSDYRHRLLGHGDRFSIGFIEFQALHTPGHTPEHIALVVTDAARGPEPWFVLTGHTLMVGDMGRTELATSAEEGARALFRSAARLRELPDHLEVLPGAFSGSVCGRGLSGKATSTIGFERRFNRAFAIDEEEAFVALMLREIPPRPGQADVIRARNLGLLSPATV